MDKLEVRNRHHVKNAEKGLFAVKIWPQSAKPIRQVAHNIVVKKKKKKKNYVTSLICLSLRGISLRSFPSTSSSENLADNQNVIKRERVTVLVNHAEQCLWIRLFCPLSHCPKTGHYPIQSRYARYFQRIERNLWLMFSHFDRTSLPGQ